MIHYTFETDCVTITQCQGSIRVDNPDLVIEVDVVARVRLTFKLHLYHLELSQLPSSFSNGLRAWGLRLL